MATRRRVGIFGWGVVAPKSPDIASFEHNLEAATSWLEPFEGFGPNSFLVGRPPFDFADYKEWIDARHEPRRFSQVDRKAGSCVKYAVGAFIQALGQNAGLEAELQSLGDAAHVYIGTGLGDFPLQYDVSLGYHFAQREWNRFWCRDKHNADLARVRAADGAERSALLESMGAPVDPATLDPETADFEAALDGWLGFWARRSSGLGVYLAELREIESGGIDGDVEAEKGNVIRRKLAARRKLAVKWGCPAEPWNSVDANALWNIPNIPASQITMLGRITGASLAPIAACAGFGTALKLADNAIQLGQAKAVVVGMTDPEPHALSVGAFFQARVISHDGQVSKPFTEMRGTHISGGACVWIVGDWEYLTARGMTPVGLEIISVALSSDADHIITPSSEGPRRAIDAALRQAEAKANDIATWDMHATATPGDWSEMQNTLEFFGADTLLTARKGSFGHGMSVCGGWELTAQHLGVAKGVLHPVNLEGGELHPQIAPYHECLVFGEGSASIRDGLAGKINMGVGGINACVICRRWDAADAS